MEAPPMPRPFLVLGLATLLATPLLAAETAPWPWKAKAPVDPALANSVLDLGMQVFGPGPIFRGPRRNSLPMGDLLSPFPFVAEKIQYFFDLAHRFGRDYTAQSPKTSPPDPLSVVRRGGANVKGRQKVPLHTVEMDLG